MQKPQTFDGASTRTDPPAAQPSSGSAKLVELSVPPSSGEPLGNAKPSRWLAPIALALGIVCLSLACWLQTH